MIQTGRAEWEISRNFISPNPATKIKTKPTPWEMATIALNLFSDFLPPLMEYSVTPPKDKNKRYIPNIWMSLYASYDTKVSFHSHNSFKTSFSLREFSLLFEEKRTRKSHRIGEFMLVMETLPPTQFASKTLLLLRGIPGAGKTTLANQIAKSNNAPIFSIDSYFTNERGEYKFDFTKNHLAYKECESKTKDALEKTIPFVIVDNTFTLEWEMKPYEDLAKHYGYLYFVVTVENRHGGENVHQIPVDQIEKMKAKFKVIL